jgi:hypothetical protein
MTDSTKTSRIAVGANGYWCDRDHCAKHGRMTCVTEVPPAMCRAMKRSGERRVNMTQRFTDPPNRRGGVATDRRSA